MIQYKYVTQLLVFREIMDVGIMSISEKFKTSINIYTHIYTRIHGTAA